MLQTVIGNHDIKSVLLKQRLNRFRTVRRDGDWRGGTLIYQNRLIPGLPGSSTRIE
ncbi:hypothetical protein D3C85_1940410 [compost metagenome]